MNLVIYGSLDKKLPRFSGAEDADDARRSLEKADENDEVDEEEDWEEVDALSSMLLMGFLYWRSPMARDILRDPISSVYGDVRYEQANSPTRAVPVLLLTVPPASSIRDLSVGTSGLWLTVNRR